MKEVEQLQAKGRMTLGVKEAIHVSHLEKVDLSKSLALYKCEKVLQQREIDQEEAFATTLSR